MKLSRRRFLQSSMALSAASMTTLPHTAFAQQSRTATSDYKALVIVFLKGGNDAYNMIVPTSPREYETYQATRPNLALTPTEIHPISLTTENQVNLGIHHAMSDLVPLFESGDASVFVNSGQLLTPTTRSTIAASLSPLPRFLMAHNMQQDMWQTGATYYNSPQGWAGRMMAMLSEKTEISPLISLNSQTRLNISDQLPQTVLNSNGIGQYSGWHDPIYVDEYFSHFDGDFDNIYTQYFTDTMKKSVIENAELKTILESHPSTAVYPETNLAAQLKMVSRMIQARQALYHQQQVFFVSIGGFDTHVNQKPTHHALLENIAQAFTAFNSDLTQQGMNKNVITLTMSDFGRRVLSNESGTDHGWGGHQLVMGGAIKGLQAYGEWPDLTPNSEDDYNHGRIIPGIAADQINASIARWFGLSDNQVLELFPNLSNFPSPYIDFINRDENEQLPHWHATTVYQNNDLVTHNGQTWQAAWWTQGNEPDKHEVWKLVTTEENNLIAIWSASRIYREHDIVTHKNIQWKAAWYTKGEEPGTTGEWGVWRKKG